MLAATARRLKTIPEEAKRVTQKRLGREVLVVIITAKDKAAAGFIGDVAINCKGLLSHPYL